MTKSQTILLGDDPTLLAALQRGDHAAYEKLVTATAGYLYAVAKRMLKSDADAHDAVQDAMLQIYKSISKFEARSSLLTWMHRIQVTTCLMRLRSRKSRDEQSIDPLLPTFTAGNHQTNPGKAWRSTPDHDLAHEETRQQVRTAIDQLPETYRTILILRDIEQLSTEETCSILQINESVAKTRLHRARQALKTLLDPLFSGPDGGNYLPLLLFYCFIM